MKKRYEVTAEYSKVMKQFEIYTSNAHKSRIARQVGKNLFYSDKIKIIKIKSARVA